MIAQVGFSLIMVAAMFSACVLSENIMFLFFILSRLSLLATCEPDSSPEIYKTEDLVASASATWSMRVDFPIPGSPVISMTAPGTTPPPSTRSTSCILVGVRDWFSSENSVSGFVFIGVPFCAGCSTSNEGTFSCNVPHLLHS